MTAKILWFTGLSGSGKTTIATKLEEHLKNQNRRVLTLDGDVVRETLHKNLGFTPDDIHENNRLIAQLAKDNAKEYDFIIVPIISPFREDRNKARALLEPDFIEVFIDTPLEECIKRDVKGHYQKALKGEIKNFIGVAKENPYQPPSHPEIHIKTKENTIEQAMQIILTYFNP
ncbi:adenylyl-sulfate kinase [Candidatus Woesearchaeota archaeon]|nr:adenylyl-sulfate kinase [Candidatus Woesearchaeota archaeon]